MSQIVYIFRSQVSFSMQKKEKDIPIFYKCFCLKESFFIFFIKRKLSNAFFCAESILN